MEQTAQTSDNGRIASLIGIAMKAGRVIFGTERVCDSIRTGTPYIAVVLISRDASANTLKRAVNCCAYYQRYYLQLQIDSQGLGHAIGKKGPVSVIALTDNGFKASVVRLTGSEAIKPPLPSDAADPASDDDGSASQQHTEKVQTGDARAAEGAGKTFTRVRASKDYRHKTSENKPAKPAECGVDAKKA